MGVTFHHRTLSNGLNVVAELDPSAHTAAAGFFVRTGARDESPALMGVSHFLEHMMFKGTTEITADELNRRFDALGAKNNAFTSAEVTCFYASCLPEMLDEGVSLLARMMRPAIRVEDFTTEKKVILEEIAMYEDNPFWVLYERANEKFYGSHPLANRVLGARQTVADLTRDQMHQYFDQRYAADNTTVALAGKLDLDRTVEILERLCGGWQVTNPRRDITPPPTSRDTLEIRDAKFTRAYMLGLSPGPSIDDDRRYAASLISQHLGGSDNSLLHWALVENGIAEEAQSGFDAHEGTGTYMLFASGDPDRADEIWTIATEQCRRAAESCTADDLERLRNRLATALTLGAERPGDRMHRLGKLWAATGRYRPLEEELEKFSSVTLDHLREVSEAFPPVPSTVGRLLPA